MKKIILILIILLFLSKTEYAQTNTATGEDALFSVTTGEANTATGFLSMYFNTTGSSNSAHGAYALYRNTSGIKNSAYGHGVLSWNTSGYDNTALGNFSLRSNATGYRNTAIGWQTMYYSGDGSYISTYNTAVGNNSLYYHFSTSNNVAVGDNAGFGYFMAYNANNNTFIGANSGMNAAYSNTTAIGSYAVATASNMVVLGDANVTLIGGQVNWSTLSDKRIKREIKKSVPGLSFINKLKPVSYLFQVDEYNKILRKEKYYDSLFLTESYSTYKSRTGDKKKNIRYTGLIAQDVESVAKKIGYDFSGVDVPKNDSGFYSIKYAELVVPLVQATKELLNTQDSLLSILSYLQKEYILLKSTVDSIDVVPNLKNVKKNKKIELKLYDKSKSNESITAKNTITEVRSSHYMEMNTKLNKKSDDSKANKYSNFFSNSNNEFLKYSLKR